MKDIAIAGGLIYVAAAGAGIISLDTRRGCPTPQSARFAICHAVADRRHHDRQSQARRFAARVVRPTAPRVSVVSTSSVASRPAWTSDETTPPRSARSHHTRSTKARPKLSETVSTTLVRSAMPLVSSSRSTKGRITDPGGGISTV